ncbi:M20/M25/M40 family metallo-hydrolase, partial [Synergistaceae bacterium OttesenSCG-928-D05]|nr:M20/M25/M40 family metallo-hydrolase [Synergistaceae bacterium OttesenSCG-928-D05]
EAREDLESGEWIFGRGVADMKGGGVIQMAFMEWYSKQENFKGNLVLLGLCDEENLSAGARTAPLLLKELKEKYGLNYVLSLNSEPIDDKGGVERPQIDVGSIGKIMPLIHARGTLAHTGMVYEGLSPVKLMAEVVHRLDLNPAFIDEIDGITSPAASFLYLKDEKQIYDVSLPLSASGFMSIMFVRRSPDEMMRIVKEECVKAFNAVIEGAQKSYDVYLTAGGSKTQKLPWKTNVKLYAELHAEALRDSGETFTDAMKELSAALKKKVQKGEMNLVEASLAVVKQTMFYIKDQSPCIVIALVPPYYPVVANSMLGEQAGRVNEVCDKVIAYAKEKYNRNYVKSYIGGMSDLSYFMQNPSEAGRAYVEENMLLLNDLYDFPFNAIDAISMPVLNVGPLGKNIHKYTERVLKKDLFERTPALMKFTIESMLH